MIDIDVSKIASEIGEPTARFIENEESKKQRKNVMIFSIVFLTIFIITAFLFLIFSNMNEKQVAQAQKDIAQLTSANQGMLSVESAGKEIEKRNNSVAAILNNNPNWSFVFEKLEKVVPTGITFSGFEADSPASMKIAGLSPDYPTLSILVVAMQQMKDEESSDQSKNVFANVSLSNASLVTLNNNKYVDFIINFGVAKKISHQALYPAAPINTQPAVESAPAAVENTPAENPTANSEVSPAPENTATPETTPTSTPAPTPTPEEGGSLPVL